MDPEAALVELGGAAGWATLRRCGVTDGRLRRAVAAGRVEVLARGSYAVPGLPPDVAAAARVRGRLTCVSAAAHWGLGVLTPPDEPHVAVPRDRPAAGVGVVVHRVDVSGAGLVVPVVPALVAVARCLPLVDAVVILDSALGTRQVTRGALLRRLRGPGSVAARAAVLAGDARSGSPVETVVRLGMLRAGLPCVPQAKVPGVGRVDFLVGGWLVVEVDGFAHHRERAQFREDRRRSNAAVRDGLVVLRFTYEDVRGNLPGVVALVREVYGRGR